MRNKRGVLNAMEQPNHGHIGQGITSRWLQWYEPHEKSITFFLNVLTAFGTACAAMALIPTCVQIQQAQKTLTATTEYQISKDSAELWDSIPDDVWQHLRASGPLDLAAERQVLRIFSFVAAVQEQKQLVNT